MYVETRISNEPGLEKMELIGLLDCLGTPVDHERLEESLCSAHFYSFIHLFIHSFYYYYYI